MENPSQIDNLRHHMGPIRASISKSPSSTSLPEQCNGRIAGVSDHPQRVAHCWPGTQSDSSPHPYLDNRTSPSSRVRYLKRNPARVHKSPPS